MGRGAQTVDLVAMSKSHASRIRQFRNALVAPALPGIAALMAS
jgi:hypothetical protein